MDRPARRPGPPVDAARLQPDNQADIQHVDQPIDEGLVAAWLDDPDLAAELADELERLRRLQADEDLLLTLQLHQFTGRPWDRFSRELARYGLGVLRAWIRYGTIYGKAKALTGYGLGRIEGWPNDEVVEDIADRPHNGRARAACIVECPRLLGYEGLEEEQSLPVLQGKACLHLGAARLGRLDNDCSH